MEVKSGSSWFHNSCSLACSFSHRAKTSFKQSFLDDNLPIKIWRADPAARWTIFWIFSFGRSEIYFCERLLSKAICAFSVSFNSLTSFLASSARSGKFYLKYFDCLSICLASLRTTTSSENLYFKLSHTILTILASSPRFVSPSTSSQSLTKST